MDIGKLKNNNQFAADWAETEVALILKEAPEFSLYIEEGYFWDIFGKPILDVVPWVGFTRDYQEEIGGWDAPTEIKNIDEYLEDILRYREREFLREKTSEVLELIISFLIYAKETGQSVIVDAD